MGDAAWVRGVQSDGDTTSVSVVIPHFGDPVPTLALVEQLISQTYPVQLIVADDASPMPFPSRDGVEVVRRALNGGFGANVNSGAALATGEAMLVLNSDLTVEPNLVAEMVAAAKRYPDTVLAPRVVDDLGIEAWTARKFPRIRHQAVAWLSPLARWRHTSLWHRWVGHDASSQTSEVEVDWVVGAAMWIPLPAFRAVGGFDETFFMNSEEIDLQRRLRERGVPSIALRSPTVVHAGGGSSPSESRRRWLVEGQMLYASKWGSRRGLQTALAAATAANFLANTARLALRRDVQPVAVARAELSMIYPRGTQQAKEKPASLPRRPVREP
jgi:GT2 family glycosyltransferase